MKKFICGCTLAEKAGYSTEVDQATGHSVQRRDHEGFLVCPEHGQREYGWRSPVVRDGGPKANDVIDYRKVYGLNRREIKLDTPNAIADDIDLRPAIYDEMLDDRARRVIARVNSPNNGHGPRFDFTL